MRGVLQRWTVHLDPWISLTWGHYLHAVPKDQGAISSGLHFLMVAAKFMWPLVTFSRALVGPQPRLSGAICERGKDQLDLEMDHEAQSGRWMSPVWTWKLPNAFNSIFMLMHWCHQSYQTKSETKSTLLSTGGAYLCCDSLVRLKYEVCICLHIYGCSFPEM